jgi:1,4-dihydroxy-2-naphthoate octaprenyltransferase
MADELRPGSVRVWLEEMRLPFATASVMPVLLGTAIAWGTDGVFSPLYFILTLIAGVFAHLGTNIVNDYFDHRSGNDEVNIEFVRPFSGGSRMIQRNLLTPRQVLDASLVFFVLASVIGLYLAYVRGLEIFCLGLIGIFSGFFYTAPPFNLAARGIGEFVVGINFGALMTLGAYFVQTQRLSWEPVIASLPITLLIAAVLYINEYPDHDADKAVGKRHLVVRLGKRGALPGYIFLLAGTYVSVVVAVIAQVIPIWTLIALLTIPLAVKAGRVALANYADTKALVPANAGTVMNHMLTGILMTLAYLLYGAIG